MAQSKPSATGKSRGAVARRRMDIQMVQNALLVWLDNNIDHNNADCRNCITQLRRAVNDINTFTDGEQCIEFLDNITDDKACMIISGSLGQQIVPRVHNMSQMDSIFIFCGSKKRDEQWAKEWPKIKGVFTEVGPICEALKQAAQQLEQNAISISFMDTTGGVSKKNLDQLDPTYMYSQILKEILLSIQFEQQHIQEFIDHCRAVLAENDSQLKNVAKIQKEYREKTPIWWYTYECFLYPMLNRALRLMDVGIIVKMGFFIGDLHRHIEQLHSEQFSGHHSNNRFSFPVYRGQSMSKVDFEKMTQNKGGLMSFNNFLSTSKSRELSLFFAGNQGNPDLIGILFVLTIDPSKSSAAFASIDRVSHFQVEDEVLFSMNTVFRIGEIKPMDENHRLIQVELTLTSDNDKDLRVLTDRIRDEIFPAEEGWRRLGLLLEKMGQSAKAQQVYETLLEQTSDESEKADTYEGLGHAKFDQGEYKEALAFYEKSLQIRKQSLPLKHRYLGNLYNNIGMVYSSMGDYPKALSSYEKALEIQEQSLLSNHPNLAGSYNNIGSVYRNMGDYPKALSSYEKSFEIQQQSLPSNHPDLAASYNNIGIVHRKMGDYTKALSSHEKALEIRKQSLPSNHPNLAGSYNNIGSVYRNMGDYPKALSSYEKSFEIQQQSLPSNHPDLAASYNNIGIVHRKMGDYPKALSSLEKALGIRQQSLPSNHPDLAMSYGNIGNVYSTMGEHCKALPPCQRAVDIAQQSLPANHLHLQWYKNNLDRVKKEF